MIAVLNDQDSISIPRGAPKYVPYGNLLHFAIEAMANRNS